MQLPERLHADGSRWHPELCGCVRYCSIHRLGAAPLVDRSGRRGRVTLVDAAGRSRVRRVSLLLSGKEKEFKDTAGRGPGV